MTLLFASVLVPLLLGAILLGNCGIPGGFSATLFKASAWLAAGLGLCSGIFFLDLVLGVQRSTSFVWSELLLLGIAAVASALLRRREKPTSAYSATQHSTACGTWLRVVTWFLFLTGGCVFLIGYIAYRRNFPHAGWDAWAIWDLRARFLYRGGSNWRDAFSPALVWSHPEYPLLLPASIARCWEYLGRETMAAVTAVQLTFAAVTVVVLSATLAILRGSTQGALASLALLSTPFFLGQSASGFADVAVGTYFLLAMSALLLAERAAWNHRGLLLSGLFAGFAAWTKNEGQLFLLALLMSLLLWHGARSGVRVAANRTLVTLAGALPALGLLLVFRMAISTGTEFVFQHQTNVMAKVLSAPRYLQIGRTLLEQIPVFGGWTLPMVPCLAVYGMVMGICRKNEGLTATWIAAFTLLLTLAGYLGVYVITPADLTWHLNNSLDRLLLQLWPGALLVFFLVVRSPGDSAATGESTAPNHMNELVTLNSKS